MRKFEDFTGRRYEKLVVVEHIKTSVYKDGALVNTFDSITDAAKFCGVNEGMASMCLNGKKKTSERICV